MRIIRALEPWLRRTNAANDQGVGNLYQLPYADRVQPVEIVSDATQLITPYQRRLYWDRVVRSASGVPGEFSYVGLAPVRFPIRVHYWQVESIGAGNSFFGLMNMALLGAVSGNVAPLEPFEGPRDFTTTIPFSMFSASTAGSDGQIVGAREIPWVASMKPVIWPGQVLASQTITDQVALTCVFAFEELQLIDPSTQVPPGDR